MVCEAKVAEALAGLRLRVVGEPLAEDALPFALERIAAGDFDDAAALDANYLRRTDAGDLCEEPDRRRVGCGEEMRWRGFGFGWLGWRILLGWLSWSGGLRRLRIGVRRSMRRCFARMVGGAAVFVGGGGGGRAGWVCGGEGDWVGAEECWRSWRVLRFGRGAAQAGVWAGALRGGD